MPQFQELLIKKELCRLCVDNALFCGVAPGELDGMDLADSGHFDSMALTFLKGAVDDEWGVEIAPALFLTKLRTLSDVASFIQTKLSGSQFHS